MLSNFYNGSPYFKGSSHFNPYFLPIDFSIIGTVHSHPSGVLKPSIADLNHGYGKIMLIMGTTPTFLREML